MPHNKFLPTNIVSSYSVAIPYFQVKATLTSKDKVTPLPSLSVFGRKEVLDNYELLA